MDEDLSDCQVVQLLKDAEQRMRSALLGQLALERDNEVVVPSLPGLHTSTSKGHGHALPVPYVKSTSNGAQIDSQLLLSDIERNRANGKRHEADPLAIKGKFAKEANNSHAGPHWFNLPRTTVTPEIKRDLKILRNRSVLDSNRHYKKDNGQKIDVAEFFQIGTIIEGPTDFFAARLTKKERKRTLFEEVLAGEKSTQRFKSKYNTIQKANKSGKKGHYQIMKAMRVHKNSKG